MIQHLHCSDGSFPEDGCVLRRSVDWQSYHANSNSHLQPLFRTAGRRAERIKTALDDLIMIGLNHSVRCSQVSH